MEIILLKDVPKVGRQYEVKNVADGYGRNFLIARGLALAAGPTELAKVSDLQKQVGEKTKLAKESLNKLVDQLTNQPLIITAKANPEGKLFAGLSAEDIVKEIASQKLGQIDPALISLPKAIKTTGLVAIPIMVGEQERELKVEVKPKQG